MATLSRTAAATRSVMRPPAGCPSESSIVSTVAIRSRGPFGSTDPVEGQNSSQDRYNSPVARLPYLDPDQAEPRVAELLGKTPDLGIFRMVANAQRAFP